MKRPSESQLGEALRAVDLPGMYVYRLPDPKTGAGVSNWKPCDFMAWWRWSRWRAMPGEHPVGSAWVEAKDTTAVDTFPKADLRPSQISGIIDAHATGIPYFLAIYWRRAKRWTISDAWRVLEWFDSQDPPVTSIPRKLLMSRFGIDAAPADLSQTLKIALTGELE